MFLFNSLGIKQGLGFQNKAMIEEIISADIWIPYALVIQGDSMESPTQPSFPAGFTIVVEPKVVAKHNDFVVVCPKGSKVAIIRQMINEGNTTYLKPLNARYPMSELGEKDKVCGVVRQLVHAF